MAKYRKKPVEIEAFQYDGDLKGSDGEYYVPEWAVKAFENGTLMYTSFSPSQIPCGLCVRTPNGDRYAQVGDYIIKDENGELYVYSPDIFEKTYEKVD